MTARAAAELAAAHRLDPAPRPTRKGIEQLERAIASASAKTKCAIARRSAMQPHLVDGPLSNAESQGATWPLVTADPVAAEFEAALALRRSGADPKVLRRALRRIEELLDE